MTSIKSDKSLSLVSVGLPVFNGEKYLKCALESIINQSYSELEIILCDNASTDSTRDICLEYASRDERIKYYRNNKNLGAAPNFNRAFHFSSGKYFKWASYDDILDSKFLEKCVRRLDDDPSIILSHAKTGKIDENGNITGSYDEYKYMRIDSKKPYERFFDLIRLHHSCTILFGLIRSDILYKTPLIDSYPGSDRVLIAQLSLLGQFHEIPETLFYRRDHPLTTWQIWKGKPEIITWYDTSKKNRQSAYYWRLYQGYLSSILLTPINFTDKILSLIQLTRLLGIKSKNDQPMWKLMLEDIQKILTNLFIKK